MYFSLARTVLTDRDRDEVTQQVERFRRRYPSDTDDELAGRLIRQTAVRCAAVGAVASAPSGFLSFVPLAADLSYQVLALTRLVLSIGCAYERPTTSRQRGASAAASLALGGTAEVLRRSIVKVVQRGLRRRRAAPVLIPVVGAAIGGALSYGAAVWIGDLAREFYRERRARLPLPRVARAR